MHSEQWGSGKTLTGWGRVQSPAVPATEPVQRWSGPGPVRTRLCGCRHGRAATHSAFLRLWYERRQGLRQVFRLASDRSGRKAASEPSIWSGFPQRACSVEQ